MLSRWISSIVSTILAVGGLSAQKHDRVDENMLKKYGRSADEWLPTAATMPRPILAR
jgi:hypothetical protein